MINRDEIWREKAVAPKPSFQFQNPHFFLCNVHQIEVKLFSSVKVDNSKASIYQMAVLCGMSIIYSIRLEALSCLYTSGLLPAFDEDY